MSSPFANVSIEPVGGMQSRGPCERGRFSLISFILFGLENNDFFFFFSFSWRVHLSRCACMVRKKWDDILVNLRREQVACTNATDNLSS